MNSPCCADGTIVLIEEGKLERQVGMGCPSAPRVVLLFKCGVHKVPGEQLAGDAGDVA